MTHNSNISLVITLGIEQITHRISGSGADERGIGRWSWLLLKGKNGTLVRVITSYQPNLTQNNSHPGSVYSQQRQYFQNNNIDNCPLEMFQTELVKQIQTWLRQKNKIILLISANEDVRSGRLSNKLENIGLISAIRTRHGHRCPPTQHSNSIPIDDIFISRNVPVFKSGYLRFGDGPGDHRGLFVDVDSRSLFGGSFHHIHRLPARRLVSSNPTVAERFNKLFDEKLTLGNVHNRIR